MMKNYYTFSFLNKTDLSSTDEEESVFFKMFDIVSRGALIYSCHDINELVLQLNSEGYYISHNVIIHKGKQKTFTGRTFMTSKEDLIFFLRQSYEIEDIRNFIISPIFSCMPDKIIYLDEDQILIFADKHLNSYKEIYI